MDGQPSFQATVLHVEDDPLQAALIRRMIERVPNLSLNISHVLCVADAVAQLEAQSFDICLLDLGLPDSRGVSAVAKVRAVAANLPIVVVTGIDDPWAALAALKHGAQDFLVKDSLDPNALVRAILVAIRGQRMDGPVFHEELVLRLLPDGVAMVDEENSVVYANPAALEMLHANHDLLAAAKHNLHDESHWWVRWLDAVGVERKLWIRLTPVTLLGVRYGLVAMTPVGASHPDDTQRVQIRY